MQQYNNKYDKYDNKKIYTMPQNIYTDTKYNTLNIHFIIYTISYTKSIKTWNIYKNIYTKVSFMFYLLTNLNNASFPLCTFDQIHIEILIVTNQSIWH